jgi:hypothetical protein
LLGLDQVKFITEDTMERTFMQTCMLFCSGLLVM